MKISLELIQKYDVPGPRYTSYPPVPFWEAAPEQAEWLRHVQLHLDARKGVDLYVHVPYCESLCYYCGCHRTVTRDHGREDEFVSTILREWGHYRRALGPELTVGALHLGGGTPTFLSPENLDRLLAGLLPHSTEEFCGSIEVDPRTFQSGHLDVLRRHAIRRVSLGIQDFDPEVQEAIHRRQSVGMVAQLVDKLRAGGVTSVNFDLIYGLPRQTIASVRATVGEVVKLRPELVAFYGYAHLPERIKNQRLIKSEDVPTGADKRVLYEAGRALLLKAGYVDVGMDHFSLPEGHLARAMTEQRLHRNFMGYVERRGPVLLGLGPSSISETPLSFIQNAKDEKVWRGALANGSLAIEKGHVLSDTDRLVGRLINGFLCRGHASEEWVSSLPGQARVQSGLAELEHDGVVTRRAGQVALTSLGRPFVRNVAMLFDHRLASQAEHSPWFSRTV